MNKHFENQLSIYEGLMQGSVSAFCSGTFTSKFVEIEIAQEEEEV
jgi:hypothetical protein